MSTAFQNFLAGLKETKDLERILSGNNFLDEGTYDFTIQAVDTASLDDNQVTFILETADGKTSKVVSFLTNKKGDGFGQRVRMIAAACLADVGAFGKFVTALSNDLAALEMLTGMKFRGVMKRGPGYIVHSTASGGFVAQDHVTKAHLGSEVADVETLHDVAKAHGLKRSFVNLDSALANDSVPSNVKALETAIAALSKPRPQIKRAV